MQISFQASKEKFELEQGCKRNVAEIQKLEKDARFLEQQLQEMHEQHVKDTQVCLFAMTCHNKT